jgi:DNA adenine methylase
MSISRKKMILYFLTRRMIVNLAHTLRMTLPQNDQRRLANYLINECHAKWMMVIKATPFILSLYENHGLNIKTFDKTYQVSFMNRNDKDVKHLIIKNYE